MWGAGERPRASEWLQPLVVELRRSIEICALKKSIETIGEEEIARLEHVVSKLGEACERGDVARVAERDIEFHEALLRCAGEPDLVAIWLPIVTRMILHYKRHRAIEDVHGEHVAILDAVRARDLEGAIEALEKNVC